MKRILLGALIGGLFGCVLCACAACAGVALAGCDREHHVRQAMEKLLLCGKMVAIDEPHWPEAVRR